MTNYFPVVIEQESNGTFSAWVAGLPGVYAAADTRASAKQAIREALAAHLQTLKVLGRPAKSTASSPYEWSERRPSSVSASKIRLKPATAPPHLFQLKRPLACRRDARHAAVDSAHAVRPSRAGPAAGRPGCRAVPPADGRVAVRSAAVPVAPRITDRDRRSPGNGLHAMLRRVLIPVTFHVVLASFLLVVARDHRQSRSA